MSEPLRSDEQSEGLSASARDARIEHLLIAGLDSYLASDYDQAINLWTRVLFLDRNHDRARAYIERARSAQAEQLRESEVVLHQGLAAFDAGDVERARALLQNALAGGASHDLALGVLNRIDRLGAVPARTPATRRARRQPPGERTPAPGPASPPRVRQQDGMSKARWGVVFSVTTAVSIVAAAVAAWGVSVLDPSTWPGLTRPAAVEHATIFPATQRELPLPPATESVLTRARTHFAAGRVREALRDLEAIPIGDPLRAEADRLRAQAQRELLSVAAADAAPSTPPAGRPNE